MDGTLEDAIRFEKRHSSLNMDLIENVDISSIEHGDGVKELQKCLQAVVFGRISYEDMDTSQGKLLLLKAFRLCQYVAEYLMHSQRYLQNFVADLETYSAESSARSARLEKTTQDMKRIWKAEMRSNLGEISQRLGYIPSFKCSLCGKRFLTEGFLQHHETHKHTETRNEEAKERTQQSTNDKIRRDPTVVSTKCTSSKSIQTSNPKFTDRCNQTVDFIPVKAHKSCQSHPVKSESTSDVLQEFQATQRRYKKTGEENEEKHGQGASFEQKTEKSVGPTPCFSLPILKNLKENQDPVEQQLEEDNDDADSVSLLETERDLHSDCDWKMKGKNYTNLK